MRYVVGVLLGIALTLIAVLILFKDVILQKLVSTSSPVSTPASIPTLTPQATKKVLGGGILSFPRYELTVPFDWTEQREGGTDMEKLTIKKGEYQISISQGGFGGAVCLFPGDADIEGPSARYEAYTDLTGKTGNVFRRVGQGGGSSLCEKTQYGWGTPSSFGHVSIKNPIPLDVSMNNEINTILSSLGKI